MQINSVFFLHFQKKSCIFAHKNKNTMTNEEIKQRLREVVNVPASSITAEDKQWLEAVADMLAVERVSKKGCKQCWHDLAFRCYEALRGEAGEQAESSAKYILKKGVDLLFGGIRVNAATLTDELAERIIARGFETKYFEKC